MQATSHIPRLTEVKRACVLRDVRDSQTESSPALLFWRSSHSDDWLLRLSASLAANFWSAARDLCVSPTSFLRLPTSTARSPAGPVLFRSLLSKWQFPPSLQRVPHSWPCGPHPPFGRPSTAPECQIPLIGTARQERKQRGTIIIGNPVHRAFEPTATSTESNTSGYLTKRVMVTFDVYPRLFPHHFDIQSTTRKSHCHGYSRRLPALVVNHFDNQCSICLSPPKPKYNERFARLSKVVSLKCIYLSS